MKTSSSLFSSVFWPLLALIGLTPWSAQLDLLVSRFFFQDGHFTTHPFFNFVYHYGLYLGWVVIGIAILALMTSLFFSPLKKLRKAMIFLILSLAIGSGLIIHVLLKDHWGRPRPRQVAEFGGTQAFRAYYQPNFFYQPEPSKSFPCGHCSMGFYFFAVALLGMHYKSKKLYYGGMWIAWLLGGVLGFVRIAQGGHFLSDVLVSALLMWLVAFGLYACMIAPKEEYERIDTETA